MPWRTISGSEPRGQEITGVPQASASAKTMPNGSSHWMGTTMARASPSTLFFCASSTGPTYSMPSRPSHGSILFPPVVALGAGLGVVAGNDQPMAGAARDLDRPVRALDALDAAQEAERCIGRDRRAEFQRIDLEEVGNALPVAAGAPAAGGDVVAAAGEAQHLRRGELHGEAHGAQRRIALEGHDDRDRAAQQRRQVGKPREAVDHVRPEGAHRPPQRPGVGERVGSRQRARAGPRVEGIGFALRAGFGHQADLMAAAPASWRTSPSTMRSMPP